MTCRVKRWVGTLHQFLTILPVVVLLFCGCWLNAEQSEIMPLASSSLLLDIQTINEHVIAVGERGHILYSTDNGASWEQVVVPTRETLTGIYFPTEKRGWAVGHGSTILNTLDGGLTWSDQSPKDYDLEINFLDVYFLNSSMGFAVGAYGEFWRTENGGALWEKKEITPDELHFNRIIPGKDGYLYIAGEAGTLLQSKDNGFNWEELDSPYYGSFFGILSLTDTAFIAYGLRGNIYLSLDRCVTWEKIPNEVEVLISSGLQLQSGAIVLSGQGGNLLVSRDQGRSFELWKQPGLIGTAELEETPDGHLLAAGVNGIHRLNPHENDSENPPDGK